MFAIIGAVVGLAIGGGMVWLRANRTELMQKLSVAALLLVLVGALGSLGLACAASRSGGDAGMAAVTLMVFLVVGLCAAVLFCLLVGSYQALVLRTQYRLMARSLLIDVLLLGLALFCYNRYVFQPAQSSRVNDWWGRESARRESRQDLHDRIPPQYRGMTSAMLDEHARLRRRSGVAMPPLVPQEVENAIRNAENASAAPPVQDRIDYSGIAAARTSYQWGLGIGWLIGGLALPLLLRPKAPPRSP